MELVGKVEESKAWLEGVGYSAMAIETFWEVGERECVCVLCFYGMGKMFFMWRLVFFPCKISICV